MSCPNSHPDDLLPHPEGKHPDAHPCGGLLSNDLRLEPVHLPTPRLHPAKLGTSTTPSKSFAARKNRLKRLETSAKVARPRTVHPPKDAPPIQDILRNTNNINSSTTPRITAVTTGNSLTTHTNSTLNNRTTNNKALADKSAVKQVA